MSDWESYAHGAARWPEPLPWHDLHRCDATMPGHFADGRVNGVCGRPEGHDGIHWPVPFASDRQQEEA